MKRKIINHSGQASTNAVALTRKKNFTKIYFPGGLKIDVDSYLNSVDEFNIMLDQEDFNNFFPAIKATIDWLRLNKKLIVLVIKISGIRDFLSFFKKIDDYLKLPIGQYALFFTSIDSKMQFVINKYLGNIIAKFLNQDKLIYLNKKINLESLSFYEIDNYLDETLYLVLPNLGFKLLEKPSSDDNVIILIRSICSKKCIFCSRQKYYLTKNTEEYESKIISLLQQLIYYKNLGVFTIKIGGDEPLTYSKFKLLLKLIYFLGFKDVTLLTSMIRLGKDEIGYIIRMGITFFRLPVYGHNSKLHDSITREKNSFDYLCDFLNNIKNYPRVKVSVHVIILKQNYNYINEIKKFCEKNNYSCNLQDVMPFSSNFKDYKKVAVKYSDLVKFDMPAVFGPKCINKNKSYYLKEYKTFKVSDWQETGKNLIFSEDRTGKSKNISEKNYEVLTRAKKCKKCIYYNECPGVFHQYLQCFGDKELTPILKKVYEKQQG